MAVQAQDLRDLLILAKKLRTSASLPANIAYAALFRKSADALEARAHRMAFGTPEPELDLLPTHFDLVC
jgi:hypothetical protein